MTWAKSVRRVEIDHGTGPESPPAKICKARGEPDGLIWVPEPSRELLEAIRRESTQRLDLSQRNCNWGFPPMNARTGGVVAIVLGDFLVLISAISFFVSFASLSGTESFRDRVVITALSGVALLFVGAVLILTDRRSRITQAKGKVPAPRGGR